MRESGSRLWVYAVLLCLGLGQLAAAPGGSKGSNEHRSSEGKERDKDRHGARPERGSRTPEAHLERNPRFSSKLQGLLPPGTDLKASAAGFRNLGQLVAAVHVAHNLDIPFDQLRTEMVETGLSLGQAIQKLRPTVNAEKEAKKAQDEARLNLRKAGLAS